MSYPSFCYTNYPNDLWETYKGYEIWKCFSGKGAPIPVPTQIFYESGHPSESARWTIAEVRQWIDDNLAPIVPKYTLSIGVSGSGSTDPPAGSYTVDEGTVITVTAYPTAGWQFDHWILNGARHDQNPINVTVTADSTLTAYFTEIPPPPPPVYSLGLEASPTLVEISGKTTLTAHLKRDGEPLAGDISALFKNLGEDWALLVQLTTNGAGVVVYEQPVDESWFRSDTVRIKARYPPSGELLAESPVVVLTTVEVVPAMGIGGLIPIFFAVGVVVAQELRRIL
ncbi:hypothetical protein ES702_03858 [subsurface metagenome]